MLILTRKPGEAIVVNGPAKFVILSSSSGTVRIGVDAPPETQILREEVQQRIEEVRRRMAASEPLHEIEDDFDYRENQGESRK